MSTGTIICTVGTSLLNNLKHLPDDEESFRKQRLGQDSAICTTGWPEILKIRKAYCEERWAALGRALTGIPGDAMLCGAEINSIASLYERGKINPRKIVFLVSDTADGKKMAEVLQAYYDGRSKDLGLNQVTHHCIEKLQDDAPRDFKTHGLRNLVRAMGREIQLAGGYNRVAINATGGYKAQIAIAVLIGQALDIPVYYKHELFNEIISFPPLPVALDYDLIGKYGDILTAFDRGAVLTGEETGPIDEKLRALLEEVVVDNVTCWELSPIGQVYLTGFRLRHPRPVNLPHPAPGQREQPSFRDDHYPAGFKDHVNKVWRETPWITTCHSLPYDGQAALKRTGFHLVPGHMEGGRQIPDRIIGTYIDHTNFGARFAVLTTGSSRTDLIWAVDSLNQKFAC